MRWLAAFLALALAVPAVARADDDDDLSTSGDSKRQSDDETGETPRPAPAKRKKGQKRRPDPTAEEELSEEPDPALRKLAHEDDPRLRLDAEIALSFALLDKTYGPGPDSTGTFGLRVSWAPGVLWTDPEDEFWADALRIELGYDYAGQKDGTTAVNTSTSYHYLNLHAMLGYPVAKALLFYGALGPGFTVEHASYDVGGTVTPVTGIKLNLAYGAGARLALQVSDRFAFVTRMEILRYRRGYMNDTFLTLGLGGEF